MIIVRKTEQVVSHAGSLCIVVHGIVYNQTLSEKTIMQDDVNYDDGEY